MPYRNTIVGLLTASTLVVLGACSDDNNATPQVVFDGNLTLGTHSSTECPDNGNGFTVGDFGNPAATTPTSSAPTKDGDAPNGAKVSVACSVASAGNATFNVSGTVDLAGTTGGVFRIDGQFTTTGQQTGVHAFFSRRFNGDSYDATAKDCTVDYVQGVAAGRIWGRITCPTMVDATNAHTCALQNAQFRFENCGQ